MAPLYSVILSLLAGKWLSLSHHLPTYWTDTLATILLSSVSGLLLKCAKGNANNTYGPEWWLWKKYIEIKAKSKLAEVSAFFKINHALSQKLKTTRKINQTLVHSNEEIIFCISYCEITVVFEGQIPPWSCGFSTSILKEPRPAYSLQQEFSCYFNTYMLIIELDTSLS